MADDNIDHEEELLLEQHITSVSYCNLKSHTGERLCRLDVRVVGHDCKFCRMRFCIRHLLPEVHGCNPKPIPLNKHGRPKKRR